MKQLKLLYLNIEYGDFIENYYFKTILSFENTNVILYNGKKTQYTLSSETLDGLEKKLSQ